jgi:D-glycero-D-manno-heptose 1,7-bisphosphate phosphatase
VSEVRAAAGAARAAVRRAVFLDRDGTVIRNDGDLGDPALVELLPGAVDAMRRLREAGYTLVVVTNQGGVARGRYDETAVHATHERLEQVLRRETGLRAVVDAFYFCPFHPEGTVERYRREHPWRKPAPGMLLEAAREHGLDLSASWMVGDQERDAQAGAAAGCRSILLGAPSAASDADFFARDLHEAAQRIAAEDAPKVAAGVITLHAASEVDLREPRLRSTVRAMAESLAERTGVRLAALDWNSHSLTATVEGGEIVALGFAAELRRSTDGWWRAHGGSGPLWAGA